MFLNSYSSTKKNQNDSNDFWHRKLTLKVKFWHFLTPPWFITLNDFVWECWFLAETISNVVSLLWNLHNRYCHNYKTMEIRTRTWNCKDCWRENVVFQGKYWTHQMFSPICFHKFFSRIFSQFEKFSAGPKFYGRSWRFKTYGYGGRSLRPFLWP